MTLFYYSIFLVLIIECCLSMLCSDFNEGFKVAFPNSSASIVCPYDRVSRSICTESFPFSIDRVANSHEQPDVEWKDIVLFMVVNSKGVRSGVIHWWLQFLTAEHNEKKDLINLVLLSDACPSGSHTCNDAAIQLQTELLVYSILKVHIVRALPTVDSGYQRLACKLITGFKEILNLFPSKKYYFKMDDDTVIFPKRLLYFIKVLDRTTNSSTVPLYFGTVSHLQKSIPLCGEMGWLPNSKEPGAGRPTYGQNNKPPEGFATCYAQGGAGYGLNNIAMRSLATAPSCTVEMDLESSSEDTYVGFALFRNLNTTLIHCGLFRPNGHSAENHMHNAISFHHISDHWLATRNVTDMKIRFPDII